MSLPIPSEFADWVLPTKVDINKYHAIYVFITAQIFDQITMLRTFCNVLHILA